jgi:isopenicillin-N epimerase
MIGAMASLPVPASKRFSAPSAASALERDALHEALFHDFAIEAPVISCPAHPGRLLRISAQAYNTPDDYQRLAEAVRKIWAED